MHLGEHIVLDDDDEDDLGHIQSAEPPSSHELPASDEFDVFDVRCMLV